MFTKNQLKNAIVTIKNALKLKKAYKDMLLAEAKKHPEQKEELNNIINSIKQNTDTEKTVEQLKKIATEKSEHEYFYPDVISISKDLLVISVPTKEGELIVTVNCCKDLWAEVITSLKTREENAKALTKICISGKTDEKILIEYDKNGRMKKEKRLGQ